MQKVKEIHKRKDNPPVPVAKPARRIVINNDILFLLSLASPGIRRILPRTPVNSGQGGLRSTVLRVEHSYSFDTSLRFYVNLRLLQIRNASSVHFRALDGKSLDVLVLDSVSRFDFSGDPAVSVRHLVLKSIRMSVGDFSCMLSILSPVSLELVSTHLLESTAGAVHQALSNVMELDLCGIETKDSFLDFGRFLYLVREKRPKRFSFASAEKLLSYSCTGTSLSYLVVREPGSRVSRITSGLSVIDVLVLKTLQSFAMLPDRITKSARHLVLESVPISLMLLKRLGRPASIVLERCSFESLCFYEFVDAFCDCLRYLGLNGTEVPLDCIAYMKRKLADCRIELNGSSLLHIARDG